MTPNCNGGLPRICGKGGLATTRCNGGPPRICVKNRLLTTRYNTAQRRHFRIAGVYPDCLQVPRSISGLPSGTQEYTRTAFRYPGVYPDCLQVPRSIPGLPSGTQEYTRTAFRYPGVYQGSLAHECNEGVALVHGQGARVACQRRHTVPGLPSGTQEYTRTGSSKRALDVDDGHVAVQVPPRPGPESARHPRYPQENWE
jgi:hypothetical protein